MEPIYAITMSIAVGYGAAVTYLLVRSLRRSAEMESESHVWWKRFHSKNNQVVHLGQQMQRLEKQLLHTEKLLSLQRREMV